MSGFGEGGIGESPFGGVFPEDGGYGAGEYGTGPYPGGGSGSSSTGGGYGSGAYGSGPYTSGDGWIYPDDIPVVWYPDRWGSARLGTRRVSFPYRIVRPYDDRWGFGTYGRRYNVPITPAGRQMAQTCYLTLGRVGASGDLRFARAGEMAPAAALLLPRLRAPVVYVLDGDRVPIACIDAYESFEYEERWNDPDEWSLRANIHMNGVPALAYGKYIAAPLPSGDLVVGMIEGRDLSVGGNEDTEIAEVSGRCYGATLEGRIALHDTDNGDGYDTWTPSRGSAADAMVHYVNVNAIEPAAAWRKIPNLAIGLVPATSARISYNARFQPLTEVLSEIGIPTGLGWRVRFDHLSRGFLFEPRVGRDRTAEILFSPAFGNVRAIGFSHSTRNARTIAQVAGQGEGADRIVRPYYDARQGQPSPWGLDAREMFVDARDIEVGEDGELAARALAKLSEAPIEQSVEFEILEGGAYQYPRDFLIGDIVRAEYPGWAAEVSRVIGVGQRWDEAGRAVWITVGADRPDVGSVMINLARRQAVRGRV